MWEIILNWVELHPRSTGLGIAFAALVIWSVWWDTRPHRCGHCGSRDTKKTGRGKTRMHHPGERHLDNDIVDYYFCNRCQAYTFEEHVKEKAPRKRRCKECRSIPFPTKHKRFCLRCCIVMVFKAGRPLEPSWLLGTLPSSTPGVESSSKVNSRGIDLTTITEGKTGEKVIRSGRYHCHRCDYYEHYSARGYFFICKCGGFGPDYKVIWIYSKYQYNESAGSTHCIGCGCSVADAPGFYGSGHSKAGYCYDCGDS